VPPGAWWVHVWGTYEKGGEVRALPDGIKQRVVVERGGRVEVKLDLDPNATEYRIKVTDANKPIPNAKVFLDDQSTPVITDANGVAVLMLPKGQHLIRLEVLDEKYARKVNALGGKVQVVSFDVDRERREAKLAAGLDLSESPPMATVEAPASAVAIKTEVASQPRPGTIRGFPTDSAPPLPPANPTANANGNANPNAHGLERYQRVVELGRGAMGVVWRGRDTVLERDVAIKIVSDEVRNNKSALEMFLQEGKAMAALNHPNLVTVFDQGVDGNETFMVMEFIEGQTLEGLMQTRGGPLEPEELLGIAEQICAGLAYAHGRRILHRDIKPANIFLTSDGVVKIGDFGLARAVQQARLTQTKVCGTPLYMSPEQIRGSGIDFRSDLYSVGCTLFELATGQPPFVQGEVLYHHMHTQPPKPSQINPVLDEALDKLILACLEKEIDGRPPSAEALRTMIRPLKARYR
jgi:predicted Ser/Thr protein kinase